MTMQSGLESHLGTEWSMPSRGSGCGGAVPRPFRQLYSKAEIMQVLCSDHHDRESFFSALLLRDIAQKRTSNKTRTTAQGHLALTQCVNATSLSCPHFLIRSRHALSPFLHSYTILRKIDVRCVTLLCEEVWAHAETSRFPLNHQHNAAKNSFTCSPRTFKCPHGLQWNSKASSSPHFKTLWPFISVPCPGSAAPRRPQGDVSQAGSLGSIFSDRS